MSPESALGRFAPESAGGPTVEVHLLRLPLRLMMRSREHHDGLMRELRLLALAGDVAETDAPARLVRLVSILGEQFGAARERRDEEVTAALARGEQTIDMVDVVPEAAAAAAAGLKQLVDEADAYCRQMLLVTVPRPPLVREFADWYISQYVDQAAGRPPTPWTGPLDSDD